MRSRKVLQFLAILIATSLVLPVAGCGKKKAKAEAESNGAEVTEEEENGGEYPSYAGGAAWGENCEGSAISLDGTTAVVTVLVHEESKSFDKKNLSALKKKVAAALDFIEKSAGEYKANASFVYDKKDLEVDYPFYGESIEDFEAEDYDGIIDEINTDSIKVDDIRKKYKADGVLYLFLIDSEGDAFASPHWVEDGPDYFSEGAYIFATAYNEDYDPVPVGPNVIVNQILKTFGAIDLDYPDATYGYTTKLCDAARNKYQDDVMLSVYEKDGSIDDKKCTKKITDITAYSLGLIKDFAELSESPAFKKTYKYSFEDCYIRNCGENDEHAADYDWIDEWDEFDDIDFDEEWDEEDWDESDDAWFDVDDADWDEIEADADAEPEDEERTE